MTRPIPLTALLIVAALLAAEGVAAERITESTRRYEELWKPSEGARPGLSRRVRALFRDTSKPAASEPVRPADEADTIGYPATDIHRLGEALESTPATTATAAWRRPQRPKHHVGDRIQNDEPLVAIHQLQRRRAFPREADYRPSKLFRPHPSTRRVWRTLRLGDEVLAATSGGLLQLAPDRPPRLLLPGIQVHDLDQDVARTDAALVATSRGLFRFLGGEVTPVHPTPTTSVLSLPSRGLRLTGHPHGVVQWVSEDGAERITRIQSRSPILYLVVHDRRVFAANGEGFWSIHPNGDVFEEAITPEPPAPPLTWLGVHERAVHAGTPLGMYRLSPRGWEQVGPQVHVLGARSLAGTLLVGTADSGTFEVSGGSWVPLDAELPEVTDFARAPGGRLVVGTLDQGLLREAEVGYRPVLDLASEPPGNRVPGLAWSPDRRSLFVGTYDHGVGLLA